MQIFIFMKSAGSVADKYSSRAAAAAPDYIEGAQSTSKDQAALAAAAAPIYAQAVQQSIANKSFERGLQRSGKGKWLAGITQKGGGRFAEGVMGAQSAYATESAKFDTARGAASSTPRAVKGSPANLQRVAVVVNALVAAKKTK